jgi:hypothetical protein
LVAASVAFVVVPFNVIMFTEKLLDASLDTNVDAVFDDVYCRDIKFFDASVATA